MSDGTKRPATETSPPAPGSSGKPAVKPPAGQSNQVAGAGNESPD
jgi:hypothetical protein